jgi:hypothetical protein
LFLVDGHSQLQHHFLHPANARYEPVHFVSGVINGKRRPRSSGNAEALHERLAAVVTRANGNTLLIQNNARILVVYAIHDPRYHPYFVFCLPNDAQTIQFI